MSIRLFGCVCGQFHGPGEGLGMTPGQRATVPVPFYVIEHPDGVALFDCGCPESMSRPGDTYLDVLRAQDLDVTLDPDDVLTRHLERLEVDPAKVRYVIASHLHFDHVGGLKELPKATLVVQRREWEAGFDKAVANHYGLRKRYYDFGHDVLQVDGEHDLFGDGSVKLVPSYGHTPGHQSARVRSEAGEHILVGDACYHCEVVETRRFPEFSDHEAMNRSLDALLAMRGPETVMVFGHDPAQWGGKPVLPSLRS
jgi:glyoxylase-like metal-dependent hydrolase (beta-lactamase superfamily II)